MNKLFFLLLVLTGCATEKRCFEKFPVIPDTVNVTTIRDSVIYKDTVVTIRVEGVVARDSIILPCPPGNKYVPDTARAETPLATAIAWWDYPVIRLILIQKDTTIEQRLDSAIREAYRWETLYVNITKQGRETKTPVPGFYKIAVGLWGLVFLVVLIAFVRVVFRRR